MAVSKFSEHEGGAYNKKSKKQPTFNSSDYVSRLQLDETTTQQHQHQHQHQHQPISMDNKTKAAVLNGMIIYSSSHAFTLVHFHKERIKFKVSGFKYYILVLHFA